MRYFPSCSPCSIGTAVLRRAPTSLPACGSVKFIVPDHSPLTSLGRYIAFCAALPWSSSASIAPIDSIGSRLKAKFAVPRFSSTLQPSVLGRPCPPNSAGAEIAFQPCST